MLTDSEIMAIARTMSSKELQILINKLKQELINRTCGDIRLITSLNNVPSPPVSPKKPEVQYSAEDYHAPMPDKSKLVGSQ